MRHVFIDLSSDNYLEQPQIFGGYAGEHNETILQVKLPNRMVGIKYSGYRFDFQTSEDNKISSPLIPISELNDGVLSFHLTEQLTIAGKLLFNIVGQLLNGDTVDLTSKTNMVILYIGDSPDGNSVLPDPAGYKDEILEMIDVRIAKALEDVSKNIDTSLFASAIQNTVSGGVLGINDIGALEHIVKVQLSGEEVENLLPSSYVEPLVIHTYNGDGSIVINGTVPSDNSMPLIVYISGSFDTLEKGTYTLDLGTATSQVYLDISLTDANRLTYEEYQTDSTGKVTFIVGDYNVVNTLALRPISGETIDNLLVKPTLTKVDTLATSWTSKAAENYDVGYEPAIQFLGELKNNTTYTMKFKCSQKGITVKAPHPAIAYSAPTEYVTTGEIQTITFTTNEYVYERKEYIYDATYGWTALLYATYSPTDVVFTDFTIVEGVPTTDFTQVKLYRYGKNSSENKLEYTPNADGTVEVDSLSPYMSLVTDKCGLTITATYNIDTKDYIDKKFENFVNVAEVGK